MHIHLTKETRIKLSALLMTGMSLRSAAKLLGFHHTTLGRELKRNPSRWSNTVSGYHGGDAHRQAMDRRHNANQRFHKIVTGSKLEILLTDKIQNCKWSPEQVSGWLKVFKPALYVCTQTIYGWIYTVRKDLKRYLHCRKGRYRRTRQNRLRKEKRAEIAAVRHISKRPKSVEARTYYGDWEGDTVHGAKHSGYIATYLDRKSGYLLARVLPKTEYSSSGFAAATKKAFEGIPDKHLRTLTLDNGPEMKYAETIESSTGVDVYYANPYHSWERGCNENVNGLLRYFFPKKSSFAALTQDELDHAVHLLNTRPRKRLGWRTPQQVFKR